MTTPNIEKRLIPAALGLLAFLAAVCPVRADDHGDAFGFATALGTNSSTQAGVINIDIDKDWFSFNLLPWVGYSIGVTTGTLWGSEVKIIAADGGRCLYATNSVGRSGPLTIAWSNGGALARCYLAIGGFAEFTTGTYSMAVTRLNWADADGDGMFDPWETDKLGGAGHVSGDDKDIDGFSNLEEYYLQTDPDDSASGLLITRLTHASTGAVIRWQAVEHGLYQIWSSTSLVGQSSGWAFFNEKEKSGAVPAWDELLDPSATNSQCRFYRVKFIY